MSICGVSISLPVAAEMTGLLSPRIVFIRAMANRARSDGVVHNPAAINSGYTFHLPGTSVPLVKVPEAAFACNSTGNGCW